MEFVLGFILGAGWWIIVPLAILSLLCEHNDSSGWAVFFGVPLVWLIFSMFGLGTGALLWSLAVYFPVGILWSHWRWKRKIASVVKEAKVMLEDYVDTGKRNSIKLRYSNEIIFNRNIGQIVLWVFAWPFSMLESFLGDLIDLVEAFLRKIADATYTKWSKEATDKIDKM